MIPLEQVKDPIFAEKIMGDGVAFELTNDTIVAPSNGTLTAVFPTGHAFGITTKSGIELLVHIGIETVSSKGKGFKLLVKQGKEVKAGDPIIKLDLSNLKKKYDMTTMLIICNPNGQEINFVDYGEVKKGQIINK